MEVVQQEIFVNRTQATVNDWLSNIPADKIVYVSYHVVCWEGSTDEFTTVFYKVEL